MVQRTYLWTNLSSQSIKTNWFEQQAVKLQKSEKRLHQSGVEKRGQVSGSFVCTGWIQLPVDLWFKAEKQQLLWSATGPELCIARWNINITQLTVMLYLTTYSCLKSLCFLVEHTKCMNTCQFWNEELVIHNSCLEFCSNLV